MASDLRAAGIACKWQASPCGPLTWLDAANSLHVLRIFQEAIGNVLVHSKASEIRIGCHELDRNRVAGIASYVADNGIGLDIAAGLSGKGLANMRARARALHGVLDCEPQAGGGTIVTLWLPYSRSGPLPAEGLLDQYSQN